MTKTEFINQPVEELRSALLEIFDDEDGSLASATKADLQTFARSNWNDIDSEVNRAEEEVSDEAEEGTEEEGEGLEIVEAQRILDVDPDEDDLSTPNPRTDLYTGRLRPKEDPTVNLDLAHS